MVLGRVVLGWKVGSLIEPEDHHEEEEEERHPKEAAVFSVDLRTIATVEEAFKHP